MNQFVTEQLIYVLRLVAAALCGGLIGCERQSKKKTAGTRTHVIIAVASAMMMIISKYGFGDVLNEYVKLDPSREYCESLDEDIFQFINRTLRGQNCKMVNIQLTEEASAYVLTAQLKTPADYDMSDLVGQLKKKSQLKRISVQ